MEKIETLNFLFNEKELKVYGDIRDPIFVLDDICEIIGLKRDSDLIRRVEEKNQIYGILSTKIHQIPQCGGQQKAFITEYGLDRLLLESDSQMSSQFRSEINIWLKKQNILKQKELKKQNILKQKELNHSFKLQIEYSNRIIYFLDKRDGSLLDVIRFNQNKRNQKIKKSVNNLIDNGYSICDIDQINDLNHYRMCDAREIISEMTKIH